MPHDLPPHPNLEHLMEQAKALLHHFRQRKPDAIRKFTALQLKAKPRLSDAQQPVARDYGFDSWSKLKDHVESLLEEADDPLELAKKSRRLASRGAPVYKVSPLSRRAQIIGTAV